MNKYYAMTLCIIASTLLEAQAPKMTVVIVIDQFSAHYIHKLKPFLTGGLKELTDNGVVYLNALYDHSTPSTGPGHSMLSTGTYGSFHGIINNSWVTNEGKTVACDDDSPAHAAVFAPNGSLYTHGKSARNMMVDTLSDQIAMHSYPHARTTVWSLSLKSRAAISMAGKLGKAAWFDDVSGNFTSSKAYFKELPSWIKDFNKKSGVSTLQELTWKPFFPCSSPAYSFKEIDNYAYASQRKPLVGKTLNIDHEKGFDDTYTKTPHANRNLINFAIECVEKNYSGSKNDHFVLWLSLSSLDKVGHVYGPESKEALDMIYHIDSQLKTLMDALYSKVDKKDVLFVLTADHGIQPISELLRDQGLDLAKRYDARKIISTLNEIILKKYGIKELVNNFREPQFYFNQELLKQTNHTKKQNIYKDIKKYLESLPGIRRAWTFDELQKASFEPYDLDKYIQRQLYKGRSGQIFYAVNPYTTIDTNRAGTTHSTGYAFNTQVPLIFYQPGRFTPKKIAKNVFMTQVPVTLATLLEVPRPSAAAAQILPGLHI